METLRILIVEDVPADRELMEQSLRSEEIPFDPRYAETEKDFTRELREFKPDIILCDYNLPSFNGMAALRLANEHARQTPLIIVTGSINEETALSCIKNGAADYVIKQHLQHLGTVVRSALEKRRLHIQKDAGFLKIHQILDGTIYTLAYITEVHDPYTAGHQRRVGELGAAIAGEMSFDQERVRGVLFSGLLHDVGKIAVPASILNKSGKLNEIEYGVVKLHTRSSHDILGKISFPWPVATVGLQHHERMDGTGYPHGISGDRILLESRIIAVADVVEAMAANRAYRPALGIEKALEEIRRHRGTLYDPDVVDICERLLVEKKFAFE